MIIVAVPQSPISLNNAYSTNRQGRRFLKKEAKDFKQTIIDACEGASFSVSEKEYVSIEIHCYFESIVTKRGSIIKRRHDIDGGEKFVIDAISTGLGFDDALILDKQTYKRQGNPQTLVIVRKHLLSGIDLHQV